VLYAPRYETNLLNTAGQAMDFLSEVNHDNAYVHLDTYHMHIEESGFETAVRLCGNKLDYVHIGESHRCAGVLLCALTGLQVLQHTTLS
jgi:D-psicose/D-tagatose/L-ribulose 3-epimerase